MRFWLGHRFAERPTSDRLPPGDLFGEWAVPPLQACRSLRQAWWSPGRMETRAVDGFLWAESAAACYRCRSGHVAGRGWSPTGPVRVAHQGPWKSRTPQTQRRAIQNPHARQAAWRCVGRPRRSCLFRPARGSVAGQTPRHSAPCVARHHLRSIESLGPPSLLPACASRFWPGVRSTSPVGRCSICGGRSTVARPSLRWAVGVVLSRDWSRAATANLCDRAAGQARCCRPRAGIFCWARPMGSAAHPRESCQPWDPMARMGSPGCGSRPVVRLGPQNATPVPPGNFFAARRVHSCGSLRPPLQALTTVPSAVRAGWVRQLPDRWRLPSLAKSWWATDVASGAGARVAVGTRRSRRFR